MCRRRSSSTPRAGCKTVWPATATRRVSPPRSRDLLGSAGDRPHVPEPCAVEFLSEGLVLRDELLEVGVGERENAHVVERIADARTPEADVAQHRHDAREQEAAEHLLQLAVFDDVDDFGYGQAEPFPDL